MYVFMCTYHLGFCVGCEVHLYNKQSHLANASVSSTYSIKLLNYRRCFHFVKLLE